MPERGTGFSLPAPSRGLFGDSGRRRMLEKVILADGREIIGLIERMAAEPDHEFLRIVGDKIPSGEDTARRLEEAHTLRICTAFRNEMGHGLAYECFSAQCPVDLCEALLSAPKPKPGDRRRLAWIIATQARSLHVHFQLSHPMLCTENFVFFSSSRGGGGGGGGSSSSSSSSSSTSDNPMGLDFDRPYILGWADRPSSSSRSPHSPPNVADMFQHPRRRTSSAVPGWADQAWALLMVLSEIADWRPVDRSTVFCEENDLQEAIEQRVQLVMNDTWKDQTTAAIFRYGVGFLDREPQALEQCSVLEIKHFYDRLCHLLAPPPPTATALPELPELEG